MTLFNKNPNREEIEFVRRDTGRHWKAVATVIATLVGVAILFMLLVRVTRIEAGHVGVEINLSGQPARGV